MKILHLDIETAPNKVFAWGLWDQNIGINQIVEAGYTMCWAAKWHGKKKVMFDSIHESKPKDMVKGIHDLLMEADAVCHYNGTKFDMPTLNKEFLLHDLVKPHKYPQIDLLRVVRRQFKFPSNKLDYVAQALDLGSKTKHMGMDLWTACMEGDESAWRLMKRYNIQDVRLLEKLYEKLLPWIENHPNHGVMENASERTCTNCGSTNVVKVGIQHNKTLSYDRYRCKDCHTPLRGRTRIEPANSGVLV